jgi:sugar O-acyltransferase (sialic acid O-acetyltransferase NeuD family)
MHINGGESRILVIVGAGGHGRVVADAVLFGENTWRAVYATDTVESKCIGFLLGDISLQTKTWISAQSDLVFHIAVGNNLHRQREVQAYGAPLCVTLIHPQACVSHFATLQNGCFVAANAVVAPMVQMGLAVIINHGAVVDHDCTIGNYSHIAPNATIGGDVHIGSSVLIGSGAVVLPGRHIADSVTVGAGAVVINDIKYPGTYAGIPAKKINI